MAQRTDAKRLLASLAKAARAGIIPALAVGALLWASGCGGGDSTATQATSSSKVAEGEEGEGKGAASNDSAGEGESGTEATGGSAQTGKGTPGVTVPEGEPEKGPTAKQRAEATVVDMSLYSPGLPKTPYTTLRRDNTCDGKDVWPKINWQGVPAGTEELVLMAMNSQPVNEELFFDWAVGGIDPALSGLEEGELPEGAVTGRNSFGKDDYSICPSSKDKETYIFVLYALPESLGAEKGFEPMAFRKSVLAIAGNAGLMSVNYSRG